METISIHQNSPKTLLLAADGLFSSFEPESDLVWSVDFHPAETHPFQLYTTYGLHARSMRVFPNILVHGQRLCKPKDFILPPTITRITPSYLRFQYQLINQVHVQFECFIPEPAILTGGIRLENPTEDPVDLSVEMAAILVPMDRGMPTHPVKKNLHEILSGELRSIFPVLFMTGGPSAIANPHPALSLSLTLPPQTSKSWSYCLASKSSLEESYKAAVKAAESPWKKSAEDQWMRHNSETIHIQTGQPDWDAAFLLTQIGAMAHLVKDSESKTAYFTRIRLPDIRPQSGQTLAQRDDLTLLEALHLSEVLLPAQVGLLQTIIGNFLDRIDQDGRLPSRLTKSDFISPFQECPLLASLCLEVYEINQDETFLAHAYQQAKKMLERLTSPEKDKKGLTLSWENPDQLQMDSGLFTFDPWSPYGRGLDIQAAASPAYAAMLLRESKALHKMAAIIGETADLQIWESIANNLKEKVNDFWDPKSHCFVYLDRDSHLLPHRGLNYPGPANHDVHIHKNFSSPQRLQCHLFSADDSTRAGRVSLLGSDTLGNPITETFKPPGLRWVAGRAHLTTKHLFTSLDSAFFEGFGPDDYFVLETADFSQSDISCLLPLWAGVMTKQQLKPTLKNHLNWKSPENQFGLPETRQWKQELPEGLPLQVNVLWNTLIIKGLAKAGFLQDAMHLLINLMSAIIAGLKDFDGFFPFYNTQTGQPSGAKNAIQGMVPVRLFLEIAGVRLFTPNRVALWGTSPYPWPIEVNWQGLSIQRDGKNYWLTFADGTSHHGSSETPILLSSTKH